MRVHFLAGMFLLAVPPLRGQSPPVSVDTSSVVIDDAVSETGSLKSKNILFPRAELFQSLLADPKQQQFFMAFARMRGLDQVSSQAFTAWLVGFGETLGIYRRAGSTPQQGWQVSLTAGLFGLFNWDAPSTDLINADYTFGTVISWRKIDTSARLRAYHQSSHLGDEFVLRVGSSRQNYAYEAIDGILAQEAGPFRLYGGGTLLLTRDPSSLRRHRLQGGLEFTGRRLPDFFRFARPVAAMDIQSWEQQKWRPSYGVRAGFELGKSGPGGRKVRLMLDYFNGFSPLGQFYDARIRYLGGGLYLGF